MRMQTYSLLAGIAALLLMNGRLAASAVGTQQPDVSVAPAPLLTLRQALDIALRNNRQITISGLQVEQARQRVAQAHTDLLPQLDVQAVGGELLDTVKTHFPSGFLGSVNGAPVPSHDIDVSTDHRFSTIFSVTLAQPLTQIPRIQTGISLQKVGADMAREQVRQQRLTITSSVRQMYFAILQTQDGLIAINAALKALQELERSVADNVAQQAALRADLLDVQARVAAQEAMLSTQLDTLQQYKEQMNLLLGRDVQTPFQAAPETEEPLSPTDIDRLQAQAQRDRPDLRRSALQIRQAELDRRNTRLGYLPDLSLAVSYSGLGSGINGLPDHIWTAGFLLSWKAPFDWGRRKHEIAEKTLGVAQAHLAYEEARSAAQVDVNNQIRREHAAGDLLRAAQAAQTAASERVRVALDQYQAKQILLKDVLQAQAALADTDRQTQDAGLAYRTAQAELRRALGAE
ncbi:MAG: hypothetical protein JWL77_2087 [Chthonomonadaceae bacterium]|nr:hypothetical protein [Chthonomonadaceae bacterium]